MRKSFDGLCGLVSNDLKNDPLSGDGYVFLNKRRDRIKLLLWDGDGFWIFYKRLEKGTFQRPSWSEDNRSLIMPYEELVMLIKGIDLTSIKRRTRYQRKNLAA
jgi:transposase